MGQNPTDEGIFSMRNKDYFKAYRYWLKRYKSLEADKSVSPFLLIPSPPKDEGQQWIFEAREALQMPVRELAERLGLSESTLRGFEKRELNGMITLEKMKLVAEALDCEFVYAIRPKAKVPFSHIVWKQLLKDSIDHWWVRTRPLERKAQALGWIARLKFDKPQYRREQGWANRKFR
jgi:transcriptional regulator with XRE-family HTH domain